MYVNTYRHAQVISIASHNEIYVDNKHYHIKHDITEPRLHPRKHSRALVYHCDSKVFARERSITYAIRRCFSPSQVFDNLPICPAKTKTKSDTSNGIQHIMRAVYN